MDGEDLELLISFVIRQRRFLRTLETSFTPQELDVGRKKLRDALRAARKVGAQLGAKAFREELASQAGRSRIADRVARDARPLSKRHVCLMLENYELFCQVLTGNGLPTQKPKAVEEGEELFHGVDRFYSPAARVYR
jgi:hypothetical protein